MFIRGLCLLALVLMPCFSASADEFVVVQMCDTQLGMDGYEHDVDSFEKAVVQINTMAPDLVVICENLQKNTRLDTIHFYRLKVSVFRILIYFELPSFE